MNKAFLLLLSFIIFSCEPKEDSTPSKTLDEIILADNAGDLEKAISNYTDDAILIPSGNVDIIGKNAIRENYRNIFLNSSMQLKASANEIIDARDLTIIRGNSTGKIISKKRQHRNACQ
jgi:ketosteroid isomerase-like protein